LASALVTPKTDAAIPAPAAFADVSINVLRVVVISGACFSLFQPVVLLNPFALYQQTLPSSPEKYVIVAAKARYHRPLLKLALFGYHHLP
jgi:hypothetical protein